MDTGIGATLREAREAQDRSIEDVAGSLRARVTQLRDLEDERFDAFGGDVYAKGFLKSYAIELGIDPAPLLETYRREVTPEDVETPTLVSGVARPQRQRSASPPGWMAWVLVAVIAIAVVGFIGTIGPGTTPEVAGQDETDMDSTPPPSANDDEVDDEVTGQEEDADEGNNGNGEADDESDEDEAEPEPEPEEPEGVELLLEFEDRSWMRVIVDGTVVLEEIVQAGEILPFEADDEIVVRFGNAGGVRAQLNGEDLGAQGGRGDVVEVVFTPEGAETV